MNEQVKEVWRRSPMTMVLKQTGKHMGDLVGWNNHGLVSQDKAKALAEQFDLIDDLGFPNVTPNGAYRRAVRHAVKGGARDKRKYECVLIEDTSLKIVHGFVRKDIVAAKGTALSKKDAAFETETKVAFDKDRYADGHPNNTLMILEDPNHEVAVRANTLYEELCVVFRPDDIRAAFQRAFRKWAGVTTLDKGGYWWIPAVYAHKVRAWKEFMSELGNSTAVLPLFDTTETLDSLRELTENSIEGQLGTLMDQLTQFSGKDTTRMSTLEKRVEMFDELRNKAELYEGLLGHTLEGLRNQLGVARAALVGSLDNITR